MSPQVLFRQPRQVSLLPTVQPLLHLRALGPRGTTGTQGCTSSPFPFSRKAKALPGGPNMVLLSSREADLRLAAGEAESVSPRVEQVEKGRPGDSVWG